MTVEGDTSTRMQVLDLIVEKGPVTASAVARILGLTTAAVRRHITTLEASSQIIEHDLGRVGRRSRGRPARHYVATTRGHERLPDDYSELAAKAIAYIGQLGGHNAIASFASARSREIERRYSRAVRDAGPDLRMRARALADALTQDGYSATVREVGDASTAIQLCQGHCPIREVAVDVSELCEAETQAFGRLLGVHVQRLATLAGGEHVCTTNIPVGSPQIRPGLRTALRKQ